MYDPPYTPSEHYSPDEERCHYTIRVLDRISKKSSCVPYFVNLGATFDASSFDFLIEHHLIKGLPASYCCEYCNKNLTRDQLINFCSTCLNKYTKLLISFRQSTNCQTE